VPFINDKRTAYRDPLDQANPAKLEWFCFECSFRPWLDAGDAAAAVVTVIRRDGLIEDVPAAPVGGRWVTSRKLRAGESAVVASEAVRDVHGNVNGGASRLLTLGGSGEGAAGACRGDRLAPVSRFLRRGAVRVTRRGFTVRGTSRDRGCGRVKRVFVSVGRIVGGGKCRYLKANGRFSPPRACERTGYVLTRGTRRWSFTSRARLRRGRYRIWVRGVDAALNVERKSPPRNVTRKPVR
jgi:hypothetical protein